MNGYERVSKHLNGEPVDRLPVLPNTMMFAVDQIGVPYGKYVTDHRVLVEAQIVTAERFGFDFVMTCSDPAREAHDCGAAVEYFDDQPAAIIENRALLADKAKLVDLKIPDPLAGRMYDRVQAIALFNEKVGGELFIEGWMEGPLAEAADLRGMNTLMFDFFDDPGFVRDLLDFTLEMGLRFAKAQVDAGANWIAVGDAAASLIGPQLYEDIVWSYEKKMVDALHEMGTKVRLHICGNTGAILKGMGELGCDAVELDHMVPLSKGREVMGPEQVLMGNIDPVSILCNGTPESITAAVAEGHAQAGKRYMLSAGCEAPRTTPPENMQAMCDYAHTHQP